jgi:hypothetical protein
MKNYQLLIAMLIVLTGAVSKQVIADSSIWDVETWDANRLRSVGIIVEPYRHSMQTESPPRDWLVVRFDCSKIRKGNPVLLTSEIRTPDAAIGSARVERTEANEESLSLRLTVKKILLEKSYVEIVVWEPTKDGGHKARGYTLSYKRLAELAKLSPVD